MIHEDDSVSGHVVSRTDHQAFGDEIGAGIGLRDTSQGYGVDSSTEQSYGLTEKDAASGQYHAGYRKLETQAGRWSSPDPYNASMRRSNPQSFNRYSYVNNQPTNLVDPSGLMCMLRTAYVNGEYDSEWWQCGVPGTYGGGHLFTLPDRPIRDPHEPGTEDPSNPCSVLVPTDANSRAVIGTILGEDTPYGYLNTREYSSNQAGTYDNKKIPAPTGSIINE